MEHGEEILDLELMDRIDLHDPTAMCALCDLLGVLPAARRPMGFPVPEDHAVRMK